MDIRGKGVQYAEVCAIVAQVSQELYGGNIVVHQDAKPLGLTGFRGRIWATSLDGDGWRHSWSGRRTHAACWHAYRDVMRGILTKYPSARIRTALALYEGLDGFEATYPSTAYKNIGSMMQPAYMPELCSC